MKPPSLAIHQTVTLRKKPEAPFYLRFGQLFTVINLAWIDDHNQWGVQLNEIPFFNGRPLFLSENLFDAVMNDTTLINALLQR